MHSNVTLALLILDGGGRRNDDYNVVVLNFVRKIGLATTLFDLIKPLTIKENIF